MATTTNYGWTTPDDTALVKDGAAAIRTLGSSVDTTTKALNPSTTLGDIEYRSSTANTNTRLGIGTTGQVLTVAGGVPSWATAATPSSGLNLIERSTFTTTTSIISGAVFSAAYDNYLILLNITSTATANPANNLRLRAGSTTTTTGYTFASANANNTNTASQYGDSNSAGWDLTAGDDVIGSFHRIELANPFATSYTHLTAQTDWTTSTTAMQVRNIAGFLNNTTSYDKLDFALEHNVTGYYAVYGFAK